MAHHTNGMPKIVLFMLNYFISLIKWWTKIWKSIKKCPINLMCIAK